MPKNWAKGLTSLTDPRVARNAEAHRGLQYIRRTPYELRRRGRKVALAWTADLAYAVGLAATDGCLSITGRHVAFVSKDRDQIANFLRAVGREGVTVHGDGSVLRVQLGDVELYRWLARAGLTPRKSLTLGALNVPTELFPHTVRGLLDGDGSISPYVHRPVLRNYPHYRYRRLYVRFHSASIDHLTWLRARLRALLSVEGALRIKPRKPHDMYELTYAKYPSITLLTRLYEDPQSPRLLRKWRVWEEFIAQPVTTRPYRRSRLPT